MSREFKNYIGGEWVSPASGDYYELRNPGDQSEVLGRFPRSSREETVCAIQAAADSAAAWAATAPSRRSVVLMRFADLLEEHAKEVAETLTREEGKIVKEALGEVGRAIAETRFMAGEVFRTGVAGVPSDRPGGEIVRRRVPIGPVGVITPWNFPVVSPVRKISPALAYGDTVVFKPASLTPLTALRLTELYEEAGVPPGVLNTVCGTGREVGDTIVTSSLVRGVTFTGSTAVGKSILASSAETLTRVQLEMGGKNAALVFHAEDLEHAAAEIVAAAYSSSGQRCTAISRVIVSDDEHDELVHCIVELVKKITVGYGLDPASQMGPLVSRQQLETSERHIQEAVTHGAQVAIGGERVEAGRDGFYYAPTVVVDVKRKSALAREEVFGPVLAILRVRSFEEGISICNDTRYGLAACVFTRYLRSAREFAASVSTGMVHINHGTASQPHVPFGGTKESGFGSFSVGPTAQEFYLGDRIVYYQ